jgi:hypothetical protein
VIPFRPFECTIGLTKLELPFRVGTPNNYRIDRISDAPVRTTKQTVVILILLDKFRAKKEVMKPVRPSQAAWVYGKAEGPFHPGGPAGGRCGTCQ